MSQDRTPFATRASGSRRTTKACARCRKRKIRCDSSFPTCGSCSLVNAECHGSDSLQGIERPRSTVAFLENHVAQLEVELSQLRSEQETATPGVQYGSIERLTRRLAAVHAQPGLSRHATKTDVDVFSFAFSGLLTQSPLPPFNDELDTSTESRPTTESLPKSTSISLIPRHVINIMLNNYCDIYRPQYPCLEESELYASCTRIFDETEPSHFDYFSVAMTLAISAHTLIRYDEKRAITAAEEFWATAAKHLEYVGHSHPWQRVQALQLLAHYGLLNPKLVNCFSSAAAATRLCFQLGLHRNLPASEEANIDPTILNVRRRLFWTSYNIDAAIHTILFLPFAWPRSAITINFPEFSTEKSPTAQVWAIRGIETEITANMYYPHIVHDFSVADENFLGWYDDIHQRLEKWYGSFKSHEPTDLASKIEFYEIMYQAQVFRLNRSSPRCPNPTLEMRRRATIASIALIREYALMQQVGKFFYIWHGIHYLVEYGVSLLELILSGMEHSGQIETHLDGLNITTLTGTIRTVPHLLRKVSNRWPDIRRHASAIEEITTLVHQKLNERAKGHSVNATDADLTMQQMRHRLNRFLLFSTPSATEASTMSNFDQTPRNDIFSVQIPAAEMYSAIYELSTTQNNIIGGIEYMQSQTANPQMASVQSETASIMPPLETGWSPNQHFNPIYDQSDLFGNPDSIGSGGNADWNFEEIFEAFLEGRETLLPSDLSTRLGNMIQ